MMFDEKDREIQELKKEIKNLKRQLSYIHMYIMVVILGNNVKYIQLG